MPFPFPFLLSGNFVNKELLARTIPNTIPKRSLRENLKDTGQTHPQNSKCIHCYIKISFNLYMVIPQIGLTGYYK